jgi:hypothetical protein
MAWESGMPGAAPAVTPGATGRLAVEGVVATAREVWVPIAGEDGMPRAGEGAPDATMVVEEELAWRLSLVEAEEDMARTPMLDQPSLVIPCKSRQEQEIGQ